jgi:hypothetical protein
MKTKRKEAKGESKMEKTIVGTLEDRDCPG